MLQLAPRGEIAVPILKLEAPRAPHVKRHIRPCVVSLTSACVAIEFGRRRIHNTFGDLRHFPPSVSPPCHQLTESRRKPEVDHCAKE